FCLFVRAMLHTQWIDFTSPRDLQEKVSTSPATRACGRWSRLRLKARGFFVACMQGRMKLDPPGQLSHPRRSTDGIPSPTTVEWERDGRIPQIGRRSQPCEDSRTGQASVSHTLSITEVTPGEVV